MIVNKKDLIFYLQEDQKVNGFYSHRDFLLKWLYGNERANAVFYLKSLRYYEYYLNKNPSMFLTRLFRFVNRRLGLKYRITIGPNMVGYGFKIVHTNAGVIINCLSMGNYCSATSGVVVGNKNSESNRAIIGNNVHLTLGSIVIGKVKIGDNVVVAPNSVVVKDVPDNCVVSGVPAKLLKELPQR